MRTRKKADLPGPAAKRRVRRVKKEDIIDSTLGQAKAAVVVSRKMTVAKVLSNGSKRQQGTPHVSAPLRRRVKFSSTKPTIFPVAGKEEYNRKAEEAEWWIQFEQNKVGHEETVAVYWQLDLYKLYDLLPKMPESSRKNLRWDLLKTDQQRAQLASTITYEQASQLSLPEIQDLLNDDLLEYDPNFRTFAPILQGYMDALVLLVEPHEDVYLALLGADQMVGSSDSANMTTADIDELAPSWTPPSQFFFDIPRVFGMYAAFNTACSLSVMELASLYHVGSQLDLITNHVHTLVKVYFVRRNEEMQADVFQKLLKLVIMAVGQPPQHQATRRLKHRLATPRLGRPKGDCPNGKKKKKANKKTLMT